jgi:nucleotide-binding universal stress UspA family protein
MLIVLALDDSRHSEAALDRVRSGPWPPGTRVIVLSVARPATGTYAEFYSPGAPYIEQVWEDRVRAHEAVAAHGVTTLRGAGLDAEARVGHGDPREAIVDIARAEHADLVVVGSHGRTGLAKLVLGSTASHVVTHAPCDVLVVRPAHVAA